ncbi:MAG: hypothetical protein SGPRY_005435, partial [Prymnesium sp.]
WDWEEALGWEKRPSSVGEESDGRVVDWYYHWKSPKLIEANPSALVPTLIDESGRSVYESLVCMEFIDEVASQQESGPHPFMRQQEPSLRATLAKYHEWLAAMVALPQVARTLPCKDKYLDHVGKYANASARSKVANAVRRGAAAHEIDDEIDESERR